MIKYVLLCIVIIIIIIIYNKTLFFTEHNTNPITTKHSDWYDCDVTKPGGVVDESSCVQADTINDCGRNEIFNLALGKCIDCGGIGVDSKSNPPVCNQKNPCALPSNIKTNSSVKLSVKNIDRVYVSGASGNHKLSTYKSGANIELSCSNDVGSASYGHKGLNTYTCNRDGNWDKEGHSIEIDTYKCELCLPGNKCKNGDREQCKPGKFQKKQGQTSCETCLEGQTSNHAMSSCFSCPIGRKCSNGGNEQCQPGTYQNNPGMRSCIECGKGHYQPSSGTDRCIPCAAGTSQNTRGQRSCVSCSPGTYQDKTAQQSCIKCSANSGSSGTYATNTGSIKCQNCTTERLECPTSSSHISSKKCYYRTFKVISGTHPSRRTSEFFINNYPLVSSSRRGINVVVIKPTTNSSSRIPFALHKTANFDTYGNSAANNDLMNFVNENIINDANDEYLFMVSVKDEGSERLNNTGRQALRKIGATIYPNSYRCSYIAVGRRIGNLGYLYYNYVSGQHPNTHVVKSGILSNIRYKITSATFPSPHSQFTIFVDGVQVAGSGIGGGTWYTRSRGINMVILKDDDKTIDRVFNFDTHGDSGANRRMYDQLLKHTRANSIVMVSACDEAQYRFGHYGYKAIRLLGGSIYPNSYRCTYIAVGRRGSRHGLVQEVSTKQHIDIGVYCNERLRCGWTPRIDTGTDTL